MCTHVFLLVQEKFQVHVGEYVFQYFKFACGLQSPSPCSANWTDLHCFLFVNTVDLASEFLDTVAAQVEFQSHCARLHRQMMMLLPRFTFSEKFSKQLQNLSTQRAQDGKDIAPDITLVYQQIACNITAYCRAVISVSSKSCMTE